MKKTMAPKGQGKAPLNLSGRRKAPVSPDFGMTAPPMKKGGKVKLKKGGSAGFKYESNDDEMKKGGKVKKKMKTGGAAGCYKKGGSVKGKSGGAGIY